MKHLLFATLVLFTFTAAIAQSPVYVLFNNSCMQQLEYKYTRSGESVFAYSYKANADEQYIFMSSSSGMPTQNLPEGTFDCNTLSVTDEAVKIINEQTGSRQMYILIQQRTSGYLMMPIYSALQIKRYGSWYLLVGPKYTFAIDTMDLNYQKNLQGESSPTIVRFRGSQLANCLYQYNFQGEPARGYTESTDFDFIHGIGIVRSRVGSNNSELQVSEMRLNSVNGQLFDAYLAGVCKQTSQQFNTDYNTPDWTNPAPPYNNIDYGETDKEGAQTGNWQQPDNLANTGSNFNMINCPIQPGAGYHIVQPRESLKAIARTYKVDLKSLIKWNNIKNPDHIEICQQIWLQKPLANTTSKSPGSNTPAQYSNISTGYGPTVQSQTPYWNNNYNPAQYSTNTPNQYYAQTGTHLVQKNETLFGIAKRYACAEECIRRANNFPLEGNVTIKVGETLIIPECTCQTTGTTSPATYYNSTSSNKWRPGASGSRTTPPEVSNVLNNQTQQQQPYDPTVYSNSGRQGFVEAPRTSNPQPNQTDNQQQQDLPPTQDYIVRQGETLNSIAIKHKMSVAELAALNGLAQDDKVPAGRRLVVRRYQK